MAKILSLCCMVMLTVTQPVAAEEGSKNEKQGAMGVTNKDAWNLYAKYVSAWNADSLDTQRRIINEVTTDNIQYRTRNHDSGGRPEILQDIATFRKTFPGGHFEIGDVSSHHDVALLTWVIIKADGKEAARGGDQLRITPEGKIASLLTFPPATKTP
jgi:SnoaL-like domain